MTLSGIQTRLDLYSFLYSPSADLDLSGAEADPCLSEISRAANTSQKEHVRVFTALENLDAAELNKSLENLVEGFALCLHLHPSLTISLKLKSKTLIASLSDTPALLEQITSASQEKRVWVV
jgi:hypothetical protein